MNGTDLSDLISVSEAGRLLGVTPRTIFNWRKRGLVECYRLGGRTRRVYLSRAQLAGLVRSESDAAHAARSKAREALSR
ncbi:MAG: helix-turn-helix domain-containing protein [Planctomycetes bacterium]|nr:helix-turn-helix domain-containing protein [Planctomycetota bacterium]